MIKVRKNNEREKEGINKNVTHVITTLEKSQKRDYNKKAKPYKNCWSDITLC